MDKKEIEKLIEEEKKTISEFQKFAKRLNLSEEFIQKQVDFYLDILNVLKKMLKELKD